MTGDELTFALWIALVIGAAAVGFMAGIIYERDRRTDLVEEAAATAVDELVARQVADDRAALTAMPPGITGADALELASRRGIGVREAALILFRDQARARISSNLARHGHQRPASRSKHHDR